MKDYGLYESAAVKVQTIKTAIEVRCFSRRIRLVLTHRDSLPVCCCESTTSFLLVGRKREEEEVEERRRWGRKEERTEICNPSSK